MKKSVKIVVWRHGQAWLGYLQDYPDYLTQGCTRSELRENLEDLYHDITSGELEGIRKVEELALS